MVFVTGDTHGDWKSRLNRYVFPEGVELTKDDYVIVCGDFGIWDDGPREHANLDWLENKKFTRFLWRAITAIMIYWTICRWRSGTEARSILSGLL